MKTKTSKSYEQVQKLEEYVEYINGELAILREKGKHQVLSKAYPKLDELKAKVDKIEDNMDKIQRKSHKVVTSGDI